MGLSNHMSLSNHMGLSNYIGLLDYIESSDHIKSSGFYQKIKRSNCIQLKDYQILSDLLDFTRCFPHYQYHCMTRNLIESFGK